MNPILLGMAVIACSIKDKEARSASLSLVGYL